MQYECEVEQQPETETPSEESMELSQSEEAALTVSKSEALRMVREKWPEAFRVSSPRPLKVGIHNEMKQTGAFPLPIIKSALKLFTSQERYLLSIKPGRSRVDLNGKPAGKVKLKEAVNAEISLFMREQARERKNLRINVGQLKLVSIGSQPETPEESEA